MKTILSLLLLCVALNANGATYMLLSQTNTFANNITKNATNAANAYADSLKIWSSITTLDNVGGNVYSIYSTNGLSSALNYLPSWGGTGQVFVAGINVDATNLAAANTELYLIGRVGPRFSATNSGDIFAFGADVFKDAWFENSYEVTSIGDAGLQRASLSNVFNLTSVGFNQFDDLLATNSRYIFGFGAFQGDATVITDSTDIYLVGSGCLGNSVITNCYDIFGLGYGLQGVTLSDSHGITAIGENAGNAISGSYTNIVLIGDGSTIGATGQDKAILGPNMDLQVGQAITTGGNTNRWIFGGVTNGAPDVSVDGTHYPLAPLASPALTGTPTINGQSVEGELTNKVAKAGDTMTGRLAFSGTTQPGIQLNNLTTTQRDALAGVNTNSGSLLWNTTQQRMNVHNGSVWTDGFVRLAGDTMTGALLVPSGLGAVYYGFDGNPTTGFGMGGAAPNLTAYRAGVAIWQLQTTALNLGQNILGWANSVGTTSDTILLRDAANTLAMRNGVNAQEFRLYNTYTDASNFERAKLHWNSGSFYVGNSGIGTGSQHPTVLYGSTLDLGFGATPIVAWRVNGSGHFMAAADNTYDIGASGANRPRSIYAGGGITLGAGVSMGAANSLAWNTRSLINSDEDGTLTLYNNGANSFGRIKFGGTTASFPALKRNGDNLDVRLADDSNYASLALRNLKGGSTKVLTSAAAADFLYVSVPNTNAIGGDVIWEVVATDGTETQSQTGRTRFDAVAKSTTVTAGLNTMTNNAVATAGTLTVAIASNVTTNNVWALGATATTSLTTTNLLIKWRLETPATFTINSL